MRRINMKAYRYWVVYAGKIVGGNEYREDAADLAKQINDGRSRWPHLGAARVYARTGLKRLGLDPDDNASWGEPAEWKTLPNPAPFEPVTLERARAIGDRLGVRWDVFNVQEFRRGLEVEQEHIGALAPLFKDPSMIMPAVGMIALAHLTEIPDYYKRLDKMEREARKG
jgi:hypothetical protein